MKDLRNMFIEATPKTPLVDMDHNTGDLILSGKSIPENAVKVYEPVYHWVQEYILNARPTTNLRLNLEYFNTASSIWLARIIKVLIKIDNPDYSLIIHLYLPVEDFDEIKGMDDIKEAFSPISDIFTGVIPSIGLKLYGTSEDGEVIRETLIFI